MNVLNLISRQTAQSVAVSPTAASQRASNVLNYSEAGPFSNTLTELQGSPSPGQAPPVQSPTRQNLVATLSGSRATLPRGSNPLSLSTGSVPAVSDSATPATSTQETAATGLIEQILASQQQSTASAQVAQASSNGQSSAPVSPAAPPTLYNPTPSASNDQTVFGGANYFQQLDLSFYQQQADVENSNRYQNYLTAFSNWQLNGSEGQPPAAPVYETVDANGFAAWFAQSQKDITAVPDVSTFLVNGPDYGNGYYGAAGTTQAGTLYNPTGPATQSQIQSATQTTPA